jgi:putative ABC transport system substrate-binding protein
LNLELSAKRVEVVRELLPKAAHVVLLVNPSSVATAEALIRETKAAAVRYELRISVLRASTDHEIETAFAALQELRADTLLISPDAFLNTRGGKLGGLAVRHAIPAIAPTPAFASAGGLLAFGSSMPELYRLQGAYVGRILQGQRPADLPVQQATKIELVINLKTAKALGLDVPPTLIARADEVIE